VIDSLLWVFPSFIIHMILRGVLHQGCKNAWYRAFTVNKVNIKIDTV